MFYRSVKVRRKCKIQTFFLFLFVFRLVLKYQINQNVDAENSIPRPDPVIEGQKAELNQKLSELIQKKNEIKVPPFTRSKSRFVGGGFPIDVQHSLDTVRRPQPIISVGGPIIIPKVGSSNATGNITNQKNQSQRTVHLPRQPLKSLRMPVDEWTVGH